MFRVEASHSASLLLDVIPGLRVRVEHTLKGLFETAVELRRLDRSAHSFEDRFMQIRIGDYRVSYLLDVDNASGRIMLIEPVEGGGDLEREAG
jgi:hypothetical protein